MKPIKLKMQAFGPYLKPVELDFENGLNGEKFFLITGATGAGKTSILDAICYALYSKSSGDERQAEDLRSELADFENETEVEFTFSLGEKIYKICRNPGHKMPKGKGDVKKSAELYVDGKFKTSDVREIDSFIKSRMGFNAEQFRQVAVLPQGKFRNFLAANSAEKMGILNLIFNSALYEKIERGLKLKSESAEVEKKNLELKRENFLHETANIGKISESIDEKILAELIKKFDEELKKSVAVRNDLKIQSDKAVAAHTDGKILNDKFLTFETAEKTFQDQSKILSDLAKKFDSAKIEFEKRQAEESQRKDLEIKIDELKKNQKSVEEFQIKKSELSTAETKEKSAQEEISKLEKLLEKAKIALEDRKTQREKFKGADVKFKVDEENLKKSQDKQSRLLEIERLKKELSAMQKVFIAVKKDYDSVEKKLEDYRAKQLAGVASNLAETLEDGKPCPVCGSIHHPHPQITDEYIPTDNDMKKLVELFKKKRDSKEGQEETISKKQGEISNAEAEIEKLVDVLKLDEAKKIFDVAKNALAKFKDFDQRVAEGEKYIRDKESDLKTAQKNLSTASDKAATLRGTVQTLQSQIPEEYLTNPKKIFDDLKKNLETKKILDDAWKKADKNFHELDRQKSLQEGKVKSAETAKNDAAKKIEGKVKPDISALEKIADEKKSLHEKAVSEVVVIKQNLSRLNDISKNLDELGEKIQSANKNYELWKKLFSVANGSNDAKMTFQSYYLNAMFQNVIREANERLYKMTDGRYKFVEGVKKGVRKSGLDLDIFDENTGKARPVATLSGGESFLASLSLALGLAAVVKNTAGGINLDTIFIDEGFGSLDGETLDFAMNTLADLQKDGGRLVGIISHVEELKQRIHTRLEVTKTKLGSTAKFI